MALIRRDPVGDFRSLQYDLNRFFNSAFPGLMDSEEGLVRGSWSPTVDIH
jgi:hypothetical protein